MPRQKASATASARPSSGTPFRYEFNTEQAAEYLGRNEDFIYRAVKQQLIAHTRVGRELRFSRYDLDQYLHRNRREAIDPDDRNHRKVPA